MGVPDRPESNPEASVTRAARGRYSPADEVAWYATLATMFGAAAALFTNPAGRILLVKPNYRDHWSLPGGMLEHGEPPQAGCRREVAEELGLQMTPRSAAYHRLAAAGRGPAAAHRALHLRWRRTRRGRADPAAGEELDEYRFVEAGELARYLPPVIVRRVTAALRSRVTGGAAYLPQAAP